MTCARTRAVDLHSVAEELMLAGIAHGTDVGLRPAARRDR